jgi:hypothetical protein
VLHRFRLYGMTPAEWCGRGVCEGTVPDRKHLLVTQVYERVQAASLADLERRFDWSALRICDIDEAGRNHGLLLGTKGRRP